MPRTTPCSAPRLQGNTVFFVLCIVLTRCDILPFALAAATCQECNVTDSNIFETSVPGAFELPLAAR